MLLLTTPAQSLPEAAPTFRAAILSLLPGPKGAPVQPRGQRSGQAAADQLLQPRPGLSLLSCLHGCCTDALNCLAACTMFRYRSQTDFFRGAVRLYLCEAVVQRAETW